MTSTLLTSEAKEALRKHVRAMRARLLDTLADAAKSEYQLDVDLEKARLSESRRERRKRLEDWLAEQARTVTPTKKGPKKQDAELRARFLGQAVEEAAHTLLNRLFLLRILEHHELLQPQILVGAWRSQGYANEFLQYAGPLVDDDTKGFRDLLQVVFDELALELPGLFGNVGLTALFPIPAFVLRELVDVLNDPTLASAWGDDTTLGWVYQYWNDPQREALDAKISAGGKIEPHEIASKTQMFTERYMVEWLLQNSLGLTWLCICRKNGWTPGADGVLPDLDARRAEWRKKRESGEVALDAMMPVAPGLESDWKYYVPQPIPDDAVVKAGASIADVKLLDPACGSGHFLVIAFGLFARMYEEEARHRGEPWSAPEIAQRIVARNLHGIDIDARAIQIAAASLWLRAKLYAPTVKLSRMNLVAPSFRLASLPKDDPARAAFASELFEMGVTNETVGRLVESLKGVDHLGSLLRVDREISALLDQAERDEGPLFVHGAKQERARLDERVATFLDAHAAESDLGLRLEGEQLAAGMRFIEIAKEGRYDVVVGNPPYQGIGKTTDFEYVVKNYPRGKADLCAAFLERGLELAANGGFSAMVAMRNWMFLGQFAELRARLLHDFDLRAVGDLDKGAFESMTTSQLISVAMTVFRVGHPSQSSVALQPTAPGEKYWGSDRTDLKRAALLAQRSRYEFDPKGFAAIEGEPIVYWWPESLLQNYARAQKFGAVHPARQGLGTRNDGRFLRAWWEVKPSDTYVPAQENAPPPAAKVWVPYIKGAAGLRWMEPLTAVLLWKNHAFELTVWIEHYRLRAPGGFIKNPHLYFRRGVAFTTIGANFGARLHSVPSVFGEAGASVFADDLATTLCALNSSRARLILESLNPTVNFKSQDVNRLPVMVVPGASTIVEAIEGAFAEHERARESSFRYVGPGPSRWRDTQKWAQLAVDRAEGAPVAPCTPELDPPDPEAHVSFAVGVALGRFGPSGEGILDDAPKNALPAGILFVGPDDVPDSLADRESLVVAAILAAWESYIPAAGKKPALRDWLRKDFFGYHKGLYDNRPIYFPLSSEKRMFVAWVSIHRWTESTLATLLADHLNPVLRQLDGEIRDVNAARASSDKKTAMDAEKQYATAKRLREELADFIAKVTECAERGAPPTDPACKPREVDAPFSMDLDDGVMINSAALWPLLAPQWSDPKKWWKQLCLAEGRKDYDWAHLAQRYFPTRVDAKCKDDPSLAVAHGCFWKYHPAKAFAWELRLQEEIRSDFTIDEPGSDEARTMYLRQHQAEAEAAREKERVRRERKAAKADESDESPDDESGFEHESAEA